MEGPRAWRPGLWRGKARRSICRVQRNVPRFVSKATSYLPSYPAQLSMTGKTQRRIKFQGADLEAQPEDQGVHIPMRIPTCLVLPAHPTLQRSQTDLAS